MADFIAKHMRYGGKHRTMIFHPADHTVKDGADIGRDQDVPHAFRLCHRASGGGKARDAIGFGRGNIGAHKGYQRVDPGAIKVQGI
ncbi:hypothetical protein [Cereibacter ovatus]|uniref:hypothetical protein n=1 Tax=Cereibacter ovatus TaxID=439529 RepID=UPI0011431902|nr:hypothetical protein [Cereibacter ovatus]